MHKTIETLKKPSFRGDVLDNHIADTYFYQKTRPKIRKKKTRSYLKNLIKFIVPASLTSALIIFLIIAAPLAQSKYHSFLKKQILNAKIIKIVNRGIVNKDIIGNYEFRGHAKKDTSGMSRGSIVLDNPKKYNWADLAMNFNFPINLTNRMLALSLRGNIGGERINIVLRDANNKTYRINDLCLSSKWSDKLIRLDNAKGNVDLSSINHMRVECGYVGESAREMDSPIDIMVYIKNINLLKETRI